VTWGRVALIVSAVATSRTAAAAPCPPAVVISGELVTAETVTRLLAERNVTLPKAGCPAEHVTLDRFEGEIIVSIVDHDGRRSQRVVADEALAAALIESFSVNPLPPIMSVPAPAPHSMPERHDVDDLPASIAAPIYVRPSIRGAVGARLESSFGSDQSVWFGSSAFACADLGLLCVGGLVRFSRDAALSGDAEKSETTRSETDVLVTAAVPVHRGGWSFTPAIGLGVGWMRMRRDTMTAAGAQQIELDSGGLRGELRLAASIPLHRGLSLTLGATLGVAPGAHTTPYSDEGLSIAGEPRFVGRLDVGLEIGKR
jgi:hypothetical protein